MLALQVVVIGSMLTAISFVVTPTDGLERCALDSHGRCVLLLNLAFVTSVWLKILSLVCVLMTGMWDCLVVKAFLAGSLSLELLISK